MDEDLLDNLQVEWNKRRRNLHLLEEFKVPRWHFNEMGEISDDRTLHVFYGKSKYAYGVVTYVRITCKTGEASVKIVANKTRVVP